MPRPDALVVEDVPPGQWPGIVAGFADDSFETCTTYAQAMAAKTGSRLRYVSIVKGGVLIGAAAVRIRMFPFLGRGVAYVSGGPLMVRKSTGQFDPGIAADAVSALRARLVGEEKHILLLRPPIAPGTALADLNQVFAGAGCRPTQHVRRYVTVAIDLSPDERQLRAGFHQKWRNSLNQSDRAGLTLDTGTGPEYAARFLALYGSMLEAKNFDSSIDPAFFLGLDHADSGTVILIARKDGRDVGGHVLSLLGNTAVYLFGATNEMGRDTRAGYLLQWSAMMLARQRGFRWYDLGGIDEAENPGGFQFKTRMGGAITAAAGPFQLLPGGVLSPLLERALNYYTKRRQRRAAAP